MRLRNHIIYAEEEDTAVIETKAFSWNWNLEALFPMVNPEQFSTALNSLQEYGRHVVDAADIAHHLKLQNFQHDIPANMLSSLRNPMHYFSLVVMILIAVCIIFWVYKKLISNAPPKYSPPEIPMQPFIPTAPIIIAGGR
jgi:hypothetical protein